MSREMIYALHLFITVFGNSLSRLDDLISKNIRIDISRLIESI